MGTYALVQFRKPIEICFNVFGGDLKPPLFHENPFTRHESWLLIENKLWPTVFAQLLFRP
jgi:hypothetical protein